ncbi:MAG TPA: FKBP-type peptidyl-prolyl cis-trans isomerase [Actinotalea sp.]|nr:FKBP-type peptidyl-prolyl cis-trans isomerase [Actinotalea sp.]
MRRPAPAASAALALLATLLLAGCSSDDDAPEPTPSETTGAASAEDVATLAAVTVEGETGAAPTVTFDVPFTISSPVARPDVEGSGDEVTATDLLAIDYVALSGDDGSELGSTWENGAPETIALSDPSIFPVLVDAFVGQQVGARVLFAAPGGEATESAEAYAATVMAIEIVEILPTRAEGEAVTPPAGLPVVTLAEDGTPSIDVPEGTVEPTELVVQPLIVGDGPVVETGQVLTVQYSGWLFDETQFDTSWDNGVPFQTQIGSGSVIDGWDQGLVGQTVGSQVLLVIPPELGYGETGSGESIPPNSTLIFVVDILAAN